MTRSRTITALGLLVAMVVVAGRPVPAHAELRTARATLRSDPVATTPAFPGLQVVNVRYEDSTGDLQLTAVLRSPLIDPAQSSAARSTRVEISMGTFYEGSRFGSCLPVGARSFDLDLGQDEAHPNPGVVVPLTVSPDRRTVVANFPGSDAMRGRNFICVYADMTNGLGDLELSRTSLFDGFAGDEGDVGLGASEDLQDQFIFLWNNHVERIGQQIGRVPGAAARCTPRRGMGTVACHAKARIRTLPADPTITVTGARRYTITAAHQLRWRQHMQVSVSWRRCPARYGKKLVGHPCNTRLTWPTGTDLTLLVYAALGVHFTN